MSSEPWMFHTRRIHLDPDPNSPTNDFWAADYFITERDGRPVLAQITIKPGSLTEDVKDPPMPDGTPIAPGGITTTVLRKVPMTSEVFDAVSPKIDVEIGLLKFAGFSEAAIFSAGQPAGRGRKHSPRFLAEVAQAYLQCVRDNPPDGWGAIEELCDLLAEQGKHYKPSGARGLLTNARREGLLKDTAKGRAGGKLTDKALRLLDHNARQPSRAT